MMIVFVCFFPPHLFQDKHGLEIPESTIRGLRDKYMSLQKDTGGGQVDGLVTGPRGRPVQLGQHDEAVQECVKELLRCGEKVNTHVAMETARQVSI